LRKKWKEFGLGLLNLVLVVLLIQQLQPALKRHVPLQGQLILTLAIMLAYWAGSRLIERRQPTELAPIRALPEIASGLGLGLVLFTAVMAVLWAARLYQLSGTGSSPQLISGLVAAVLAGILEEILFRGFLLRITSKIVGTWGALLITAALFGLAHAGNPGATLGSSVAIAVEAGLLLGATYTATQRFWLPIGLHIGWNFCEGSIFGMTLSGNVMQPGLIRGSLHGPTLLTGGAFGPEASIIAVVLCSGVAIFFLRMTVKKNRIEAPVWALAEELELRVAS